MIDDKVEQLRGVWLEVAFDGLYAFDGLNVFSLLGGIALFVHLMAYLEQMLEYLRDVGWKNGQGELEDIHIIVQN